MIVTVNLNNSSLQALPLSRVIGLPYPRRSITTNLNLKMILPIHHNKLHILQVKCHKRDVTKSTNKSDNCYFKGVVTLSVLISSGHSSPYHTNLRENHVTRQDNFMSHGVYGPDLVHGPSLERK